GDEVRFSASGTSLAVPLVEKSTVSMFQQDELSAARRSRPPQPTGGPADGRSRSAGPSVDTAPARTGRPYSTSTKRPPAAAGRGLLGGAMGAGPAGGRAGLLILAGLGGAAGARPPTGARGFCRRPPSPCRAAWASVPPDWRGRCRRRAGRFKVPGVGDF